MPLMSSFSGIGCAARQWLTADEARPFWLSPDPDTLKGKRDRAILAVLLGCGLPTSRAGRPSIYASAATREHWAVVDLVGKGGHIRTVPVPGWVKATLDQWTQAADLNSRKVFRCVCRAGTWWGDGVTERVVWHVVKVYAARIGFAGLAPHDF